MDRNELGNAKTEYRNALTILQSLVNKDPGNADFQHDLSSVYRGLGSVEKAQGDATAAGQSFRASRDVLEQLIQSHGEHPAWKTDLDSIKELLAD
jgi:hypothetical protein